MYANILKMSTPVLLAVAFLVGANLPTYAQGQTKQKPEKPSRIQPQPPRTQPADRRIPQELPPQQADRHGPQERRLSPQQQRQRINRQQQTFNQYRVRLNQQQVVAVQRQQSLQQQRRPAQARFHGEYLEHLRDQHNRYRDDDHDYYNDPYFYTAPTYRYYRGGRYYLANQYAVNYLQQAINDGYELGFRAGEADREDGWPYGYSGLYAYEDASYGYPGYYLGLSEYQYYFREGFRRGYEDGYYDRYHYGHYDNGKYAILFNIVSQILRLQPLR